MANIYTGSFTEARDNNELPLWRENFSENVRCKEVIEESIRENYDGSYLSSNAVTEVTSEFGFERIRYVLANTIKELEHDGRISPDNKAWAAETVVPPDEDYNYRFRVSSHPAVLDGFINEYRKQEQQLENEQKSGPELIMM